MKISLQRALMLLVGGAVLVALVPAGLLLDRRLSAELEEKVRSDLAMAPMVLADRNAGRADALAMHARALAEADGLAAALRAGDREGALRIVQGVRDSVMEEPVLVAPGGETWTGFSPGEAVVSATREGRSPVRVVLHDGALRFLAAAPVRGEGGEWLGTAGFTTSLDEGVATTLAALTRSEVVLFAGDGTVTATTADPEVARRAAEPAAPWRSDTLVHRLSAAGGGPGWITARSLGEAGGVAFVKDAARELAVLPDLRRGAVLAGLLALAVALVLGTLLAAVLGRPVRALASASDRVAAGDFDASLEPSVIREVERVREAFGEMRRALAARLRELTAANRELADRQERLQALQAEIIQRDRLAAAGRLVTELAHEIRNPVASVRNCLEVVHRRLPGDSELREFTDMAIDELLRMHELAERMLDLNRPVAPGASSCDPAAVVRRVADLVGASGTELSIQVREAAEAVAKAPERAGAEAPDAAGPGGAPKDAGGDRPAGAAGAGTADGAETGPSETTGAGAAAIPPDALEQVLLNLVQNAREAAPDGARVRISVDAAGDPVVLEVEDEGPGIPDDVLPRIFDPFFTTKGDVRGVGLGLFVADGTLRRHGGRISAANRPGDGARFRVELPAAGEAPDADRGDPADGDAQ